MDSVHRAGAAGPDDDEALMTSTPWKRTWWRQKPNAPQRFPEAPPAVGEPAPPAPQDAETEPATVLREWDDFAQYLADTQPALVRELMAERERYERELELARNPPPPPALEDPALEPEQMHAVASPEEVAKLLEVAHPVMQLVIKFQLVSDLSREEIRLLRWEDIDETAGTVGVKGGRLAKLTDGMRAELARISRHPNSPHVLPRVFGEEHPVWRNEIEQLWCDARRSVGAMWLRLPRPPRSPGTGRRGDP
jgi:hypothetical protein